MWERLQDAAVSEHVKVGALEVILAALQNNVSARIERYDDRMYRDATGGDDLM